MVNYVVVFNWTSEDLITIRKDINPEKVDFQAESDEHALNRVSKIRREILLNRKDTSAFPSLHSLTNVESGQKWNIDDVDRR